MRTGGKFSPFGAGAVAVYATLIFSSNPPFPPTAVAAILAQAKACSYSQSSGTRAASTRLPLTKRNCRCKTEPGDRSAGTNRVSPELLNKNQESLVSQ